MIKYGLSNRYKVDPYGTEEILSEVSNSVAPKLTIDYGDEVQEAEFTLRPTKGSLDTNISPVAVLNSIKGNTVAWNQLIRCGSATTNCYDVDLIWNDVNNTITLNGTATGTGYHDGDYRYGSAYVEVLLGGHKYYARYFTNKTTDIRVSSNISSAIAPDIPANGIIFGVTNNVSRFWYLVSVVNGTTYNNVVTQIIFIDLTLIYGAGNEPTTPAQFEADYYKWFGKQLTYKDYDAGSLRSCKMSGIKTTDANSAMIGLTSIPVTTLKGKLNGEGSSVVVFADGIKSAGDIRDEIKIENGVAKAIKRVGTRAYESGDVNSSTMTTDGVAYTNYMLATSEEYILDEFNVEKVMLGSTEVTKVYLGSQLIFESN